MKQQFTKLWPLVLVILAFLVGGICGFFFRNINFAQPSESTIITETTAPICDTEHTEPTDIIDATTPNIAENVDIRDLHPFYQEHGYPNPKVSAFLHAEELEPQIDYAFNRDLYDGVKCVLSGTRTYWSEESETSVGYDVYIVFDRGYIGTFVINENLVTTNIWGWIPVLDSMENDGSICLRMVDSENESNIFVSPLLDGYSVTAHASYDEQPDRGDSYQYFSKLVPATPRLEIACPYEKAKCVYSGVLEYPRFNQRVFVDIYVYYEDGFMGTWILCRLGSVQQRYHVIELYDWVFDGFDYQRHIQLRQPVYPDSKLITICPGPHWLALIPGPNF